MFKKYFAAPSIASFICIALAGFIGYRIGGVELAIAYLFSATLLSILEVCVSFDNAIVNVTVLRTMSPYWQRMFLTVGIIIAVFGMRLVFPIAIVGIAGGIPSFINWSLLFDGQIIESFKEGTAVALALSDPKAYAAVLNTAHTQIMAFGGSFLLMVFLQFFLNAEKEHHWIPGIEKALSTVGRIYSVQAAAAVAIILAVAPYTHEPMEFIKAGLIGAVSFILVKGSEAFLNTGATKAGIAAFIYLEVLDASFSFDGVIAAFAITDNIVIIMLGLGVGAFWVRELTVYMNDQGTLNALSYLEHGAFWAIGFLVVIMFLAATGTELGEFVTAGGSLAVIAASFVHSMIERRKGNQSHGDSTGGGVTKPGDVTDAPQPQIN